MPPPGITPVVSDSWYISVGGSSPRVQAELASLDTNGDAVLSGEDFRGKIIEEDAGVQLLRSLPFAGFTLQGAIKFLAEARLQSAVVQAYGRVSSFTDLQKQGLYRLFDLAPRVRKFMYAAEEAMRSCPATGRTIRGERELECSNDRWTRQIWPMLQLGAVLHPDEISRVSRDLYETLHLLSGRADAQPYHLGAGPGVSTHAIEALMYNADVIPEGVADLVWNVVTNYLRGAQLLQYSEVECEGEGCTMTDEVSLTGARRLFYIGASTKVVPIFRGPRNGSLGGLP